MNSELITDIISSDKLERKMHVKGRILKTNKAGAIVDIGVEKPALLHISQIVTEIKEPILKPENLLKENDEVDVYIRNIRNGRIEVSMKEPLQLEWREIKEGMTVKGKVVEIENFGAFIEIGAERPGMVHISELTTGYVKNPSDVVSIGDEIEVKIIDFNRRKKQIKLSMKALQPELDEIEGVKVTPARQPRRKSSNKQKREQKKEVVKQDEPTAMEIALKAALEKADSGKSVTKRERRAKQSPSEYEELLSRTLKTRN